MEKKGALDCVLNAVIPITLRINALIGANLYLS